MTAAWLLIILTSHGLKPETTPYLHGADCRVVAMTLNDMGNGRETAQCVKLAR